MKQADLMKEAVREKYQQAALRVIQEGVASCCGPGAGKDPICADLYQPGELSAVPGEAAAASLGCGNPTALAGLKPGEVVLDLGCGGGIDVLLAAQRVGPSGKVYGLDMTEAMLELARQNQRKAGITNAAFMRAEMERIPLPDGTVDVIISNCVINLSPDKDRVLAEAWRVLKPGGRLAISDIVVRGELPTAIRRNMELWVGCLAGALEENEYRSKLAAAGFMEIEITPTRLFRPEDAREYLAQAGLDVDAAAPRLQGCFMSAFISARKPA